MDGLWWLSLHAAFLLTAAAVPFYVVERRWRWRWREVEAGRVAASLDGSDASPYRAAGTVPAFLERAPGQVRLAAFTCLLFGQMFVPGLLMGLMGLIAGGVGLVSIPGLITAARLYGAGLSLLRRDPVRAYWKMRDAAHWALWLNGLVLAGSVPVVLLGGHHRGVRELVLFFDGYGALSIAQALLCLSAVRRYEDALFAPTRMVRLGGAWHPTSSAAEPAVAVSG